MVLIIAEKPSLARNIVAGIGKMDRKDGYFKGNLLPVEYDTYLSIRTLSF